MKKLINFTFIFLLVFSFYNETNAQSLLNISAFGNGLTTIEINTVTGCSLGTFDNFGNPQYVCVDPIPTVSGFLVDGQYRSGNSINPTGNTFNGFETLFYTYIAPTQVASLWPGGSLFGTVSNPPVNMLASVSNGVAETGLSIWPLFTLVGVVLAFTIAGYVVNFIKLTVIKGQTSKITSKMPFVDRLTYKPYKGYNRFKSKDWNTRNTLK
jgi:hypothetical protein